jgi:hypothetical protein
MIRNALPILLLLAAIALFVTYIDPTYQDTKIIKTEVASYDDALNKSKELLRIRDTLLAKYNTFSTDDLKRLELLLPDTVDNIRLVLDIDTIASKYGLTITNLNLSQSLPTDASFNPTSNEIKSVDLSFAVSSDYPTFLKFIRDLQDSLRIIDILNIGFTVTDKTINTYNVTIRTYWLP